MLVAKWAAARLLFRLHLVGSVLLGLSPLLYLPITVFLLIATANLSYRFDSVFYRDSGDGKELLGFNVVFLAAFIAAFGAMSVIDWVLVRASLLRPFASGSATVTTRRFICRCGSFGLPSTTPFRFPLRWIERGHIHLTRSP